MEDALLPSEVEVHPVAEFVGDDLGNLRPRILLMQDARKAAEPSRMILVAGSTRSGVARPSTAGSTAVFRPASTTVG